MVRKLYLFSVEVYPPIVAWLKQVKCVITAICLDRDDDPSCTMVRLMQSQNVYLMKMIRRLLFRMSKKLNESKCDITPEIEIVVRGEDVQPTDAILVQVICEIAAENGGKINFYLDNREMMERIAEKLRHKGVDPNTMNWMYQ